MGGDGSVQFQTVAKTIAPSIHPPAQLGTITSPTKEAAYQSAVDTDESGSLVREYSTLSAPALSFLRSPDNLVSHNSKYHIPNCLT